MAKILVVDDDAFSRDVLKTRLEQAGHQVAEAANGDEGVRLAQSELPDLVVMDVMMPKLDGWLACRLLKSDAGTRHIPVVLLTARSLRVEELRGWEAGADAYLSKPCEHGLILETVSRLLAPGREGGA